jgi:hypothetical protein
LRLRDLSVVMVIVGAVCVAQTPLRAAPTQDEFFSSMRRATRESPPVPSLPALPKPPAYATPLLLAAGGLLLLLVVIAVRRNRRASLPPQPLNSPRKLARELARRVPLKTREWRQVRAAAAHHGCASPVTPLVCPSLLLKASHDVGAKVDAKVLADVARKLVGSR